MTFTIHEVPAPGDGPPHPLLLAYVEVDRRFGLELFGHTDFHDDLEAMVVSLRPTEWQRTHFWVALPAGVDPAACAPTDALAGAFLELYLKEDTNTGGFQVGVLRAHQNRGIGTALFERLQAHLGGRETLQTWVRTPEIAAHDVRAVTARSGAGTIDGTAATARWLLHRGFALEQAERYSMLPLTAPGASDDFAVHARAAAGFAGPDYGAISWPGACPVELVDDLAALHQRFSVDVPSAGLDADEQQWDAERVRAMEQRTTERGRDRVRTAIRHLPSGRLVALTDLAWPRSNPAGVWQQITLVHPDHRGHRLGMWMKAANLQQLVAVNPAARVHTWNADENSHMLAINAALGFRPLGLEGAWQKRL